MVPTVRSRTDRCPGVLRPWPADDGALVRVRVPGGQLDVGALRALLAVAEAYGDRRVRVTSRANLQLRALPASDGTLDPDVLAGIEATGLVPSRRHDLVRNVLASPQTGLAGGHADLRGAIADLDRLLLADDALADLPGRFLFTLDDGRGDLADQHRDLGLVARNGDTAQLRVGTAWGPVVPLADAPAALIELARDFLAARGTGPTAAWHVDELATPLIERVAAPAVDPPLDPVPTPAPRILPHGPVPGGCHEPVETGITGAHVARWAAVTDTVVVTPWRGVLVPTGGAR